MELICREDRQYIENKYHRTDEPFNAYARMAYHGYEYDPSTGLSDEEIQEGLKALSAELEGQPHPVVKAKLFAYVLDHNRIDVNAHDYFIGMYTWNRPLSAYTVHKWHNEVLAPYDEEIAHLKLAADAGMHYGGGSKAGYSPLDFDHTVPQWDDLMALGFRGILDRARACRDKLAESGALTRKKADFFEGVRLEYEAILRFVGRLLAYARTRDFGKEPAIAGCLERLYAGAPETTYDAMQLIYLYFMLSESIEHYQVRSLGFGLDNTLYPFYQKDLARGVPAEELDSLIAYFLMQWSAIGNYWGQPFYLAGTNLDGTTKVNELTYRILDVYDRLGIYNPKIQIKLSQTTPKKLVYQALEMIRGGSTSIVFINEDHIITAVMSRGFTYDQAVEAVVSGCYEYKPKGGAVDISSVYPNPVKPVNLVFDNGFDRYSGKQIGPRTGDVTSFKTFREFYQAYRIQLKYQMEWILDAVNALEKNVAEVNPSLMFSATIPQCMETMTDALDGGIVNESSIIFGGIGTATDALMGVYELVFEKKLTTLAELKDALEKNWEGYEPLRKRAVNASHKYGNGDKVADLYAKAIMKFVCSDIVGGRRNAHGGHTIVDGHSARAFIIHGERTLATPDGRFSGEEISKNISPTPGMDRSGITALIRSATALDLDLCNCGACLDAMMLPAAVQGEEGLEALYTVLMTYVRQGGASIHFNIFNPEILKDAQAHPEKYRSLQVRVCGWNALWNNMPRSEQDLYIRRAENIQ